MGWFDKKSWQLRKKIRDLQSELATAERDGKYVVEQGLFFAELREMQDETLMVLGTANLLDSEEETVIRNFFERNGFSVEALRLNKAHRTLADAEILPPEELTRRVAMRLREKNFVLVDDSEEEREANLDERLVPLSAVLRTISALFAGHVHQVIVSTPIKLNMEGNRLLHWMNPIRENLMQKVPRELVSHALEPFVDSYNHYYDRFGHIKDPGALGELCEVSGARDISSEFDAVVHPPGESLRKMPPLPQTPPDGTAKLFGGVDGRNRQTAPAPRKSDDLELFAAQTLARMYKSLVGAPPERKVRNCEGLLAEVAAFFRAASCCLIYRRGPENDFQLYANYGDTTCVEVKDGGVVACGTANLEQAASSGQVEIRHSGAENGGRGITLGIAPENSWQYVLYVNEPGLEASISDAELGRYTRDLAQVFRQFPDLLLASHEKVETV